MVLGEVLPDNRVILIYVAPDGSLLPARVLNAAGDVAVADEVDDSSIVWVEVDRTGHAKPLEVSATGEWIPARLGPDGRPLLPRGMSQGPNIFAGQIGADGQLRVLLQDIDRPYTRVIVLPDGTIARAEPGRPTRRGGRLTSGFVTVDNSGNGSTGLYRGNAFVKLDQLWERDHSAAVFAATSLTDPDAFAFAATTYSIPVPGLVEKAPDRLAASLSYSRVNYDTRTPAQPAASKFAIRSYSVGATYSQNLAQFEQQGSSSSHTLVYGLVYDKTWTRDFGFGQDDHARLVRMPASIRYEYKYFDDGLGLFAITPGYVRNLAIAAAGDGDDYRKNRDNADPRYDKVLLELGHELDFNAGWSALSRGYAQYATQPLTEAEAISLGGLTSVRGLEFAKTLGDVGAIAQLELLAPDQWDDEAVSVRPSAFVDFGWVEKQGAQANAPDSESAVGTGIGLRVAGPGGLFAQVYGAWLVGGTVIERYVDDDGRFQLYLNVGATF